MFDVRFLRLRSSSQVFARRRHDARGLRQPAKKLLVTLPYPAAQSSASPRAPPAPSSHQSRWVSTSSHAACARSSSSPASTRPAQCLQSAAAPRNPPAARAIPRSARCFRNTRSATDGSKSTASASAAARQNGCPGADVDSCCAIHPSCFSRCLQVPIRFG